MGKELALSAINLEKTDLIPHLEMIDNDKYLKTRLNIDTSDPAQMYPYAWHKYSQELGLDFVWNIVEMPMEGRYTSMGHAVWNEHAGYDNKVFCPFETEEDVLEFSPVEECKILPLSQRIETFKSAMEKARGLCPDVLVPGGRYHSLFSACIRTFGWDAFLTAVPGNEERFDRVLQGFMQLSIAEAEAWAETDIQVYITHDDIVWGTGAVFSPEWYRTYIFPKYKKIWAPLKEKGIKVIYCADGNFTQFIEDVANAGADGFLFEPITDLEKIVEHYGKTKIIMGNADCRELAGTKEQIQREVDRCIKLGRDCPGYFMIASNHLADDVSPENIDYYFEYFEKKRRR